MIKKITSFTHHTTAEGERVTYTYSMIDENGALIKSNQRATLIVTDAGIMQAIKTINDFLLPRIPE